MAQKPVLGKGLASLLPSGREAHPPISPPDVPSKDRHMGISMLDIKDIEANLFQPRREFDDLTLSDLAQSIQSSGIIQPLVVRKNTKDQYELIAGERRLRAAKLAGLKQVPVVIRRSTTDRESLELALIENIQRENLNCIDEALAYFQLVQDFSLTQEEVAQKVGKDRATVSNFLRLLRLPESIIQDLKNQTLTFGHGRCLLGLEDHEMKLKVRDEILAHHLSVRETERIVDQLKKDSLKKKSSSLSSSLASDPLHQRLSHLSVDLSRDWGTRVELKGSDRKGKIVIHYSSRQDLDRILEGMQIHR